jgi:hypothetical protein
MEKGMAGDRTTGQMQPAPPVTNPTATVERGAQDTDAPSKDRSGGKRRTGGAGPASGSITHPREGPDPQATLSKDNDGTWRMHNDETGDSWTWNAASDTWRGDGGAPDLSKEEAGGGPEDQAYSLSGEPNRPS